MIIEVEIEKKVIFINGNGIYEIDGIEIKKISNEIQVEPHEGDNLK